MICMVRFLLLLIIFLLFCAGTSFSATYYVDQNHASASDSNAGTSESSPWLTLKKATNSAVAGDTVIVKAGTYIDTSAQGSYPYPAYNTNNGSSGSYITFRSEPTLAAKIQAYKWNGTVSDGYMAWGINARSFIEIDGFTIQGGLRAYKSNHIIIKNCELTGGFHPPSDTSLLWGIAFEQTDDGLIQNNYVHDLLPSGNSSHNTACVMLFGTSTNNIIEYNSVNGDNKEIYSAYGVKGGGTDDNIWRYNFGTGVTAGFYGMGSTDDTVWMYRSKIYQNIILHATSFIEMYKMSVDFEIYNNTCYDCSKFVWAIESSDTDLNLWNNIAGNTTTFIYWNTYDVPAALPSALLDYSNYNAFDNSAWYKREASTYTYTLSQWVDKTTFDDNSTSTIPIFIKAGGLKPEDYKRTSYAVDGRGGSYASVKGAYIDGNETIGYLPGVTLVSPPPNLRKD